MTTFLTNINLNENQLLNARIQNLAVAPANARAGQIYFDTTANALKVYTGEAWQELGAVDSVQVLDLVRQNGEAVVEALVSGGYQLNHGLIDGLDDKLNDKADEVRRYADQIKADLLGSAGEDYDTFKEIEDAIKAQAEHLATIQNVAKKVVATVGDGVGLAHTVEHNLGSRDVVVTLRTTKSPYEVVQADIELTDENRLTVRTAQAIPADYLTVTVVG